MDECWIQMASGRIRAASSRDGLPNQLGRCSAQLSAQGSESRGDALKHPHIPGLSDNVWAGTSDVDHVGSDHSVPLRPLKSRMELP